MEAVLIRSFTFIFIIALGNILKQKGFFQKEDSRFLSKIIMNITLPSLLLSSSLTFLFNSTTIVLVAIGFLTNITFALVSRLLFLKNSKVEQGSSMISCSGFNIGNVTIPFALSFFSGTALSYVMMFEIGNVLGWMGGAYSVAKNVAKDDGSKFSIKALATTLSKSLPFLTYLFIITLALLKVSLPTQLITVIGTIGSANTFLVFLMIGIMLEIKFDKLQMERVWKILGFRLAGSILLSLAVFFLLPIPMLAKSIVILCLASPIPSVATVFAKGFGDDSSVPALVNSIAIVVGILLSSLVLLLFA